MQITMFIVGSLIFILYLTGMISMINRSHKSQKEDTSQVKSVEDADQVDFDGMGDFSRFPGTDIPVKTTKRKNPRKSRIRASFKS